MQNHYGRYRHGKYIVSPNSEISESLIEWIASSGFREYEEERHALNHDGGRPRNLLYAFHLPIIEGDVVMKISHINPRYRLSRKIELFISGLYKDYCKVAFRGATLLHAAGLPVTEPLAFWTFRRRRFDKRSYFLYRRLPGESSVDKLLREAGNMEKEDCRKLAEKLAAIIRSIHATNLRHGDLYTGNILAHFPPSADPAKKLSDADFYLLDYDNVSKTTLTTPWLKTIGDLRDLSRLPVPKVSDDTLLKMYFGIPPSPWQSKVFRFWRNGGFDLRRRLGAPPKKRGRHLARQP